MGFLTKLVLATVTLAVLVVAGSGVLAKVTGKPDY